VTREELESLGHTDAQLERWCRDFFGQTLHLAEGEDFEGKEWHRERAFRNCMIEFQGVHRDPSLPKIGAFAETDPEEHARHRREEPPQR
jgi:hypothetical protein